MFQTPLFLFPLISRNAIISNTFDKVTTGVVFWSAACILVWLLLGQALLDKTAQAGT
jgi:hypothetical protein